MFKLSHAHSPVYDGAPRPEQRCARVNSHVGPFVSSGHAQTPEPARPSTHTPPLTHTGHAVHALPKNSGLHVSHAALVQPVAHVHVSAPAKNEVAPAPQARHAASLVLPVAWLYLPAAHAVHASALEPPVAALYVPTGHAKHAEEDVEPVCALYVPATHRSHTDAPLAAL